MYHKPALFFEVLNALDIKENGVYVDLTFGGGGHSKGILEKLGSNGKLLVFDQDPDAQNNVPDDERIVFIPQNFRFLKSYLRLNGVRQVDGILADLGVSFHQFDTADRGFSFRFDAPLDMRMNQEGDSAIDWINNNEVEDLVSYFKVYGDLRKTFKFSSELKLQVEKGEVTTTFDLKRLVEKFFPVQMHKKVLTQVFQTIRIGVNQEMEALEEMLEQTLDVLKSHGVLAIISYHSIEDRLVKNFFKSGNLKGEVNKDFFGVSNVPFKPVTRKPLIPNNDEVDENPRARSAKLRVVKKV